MIISIIYFFRVSQFGVIIQYLSLGSGVRDEREGKKKREEGWEEKEGEGREEEERGGKKIGEKRGGEVYAKKRFEVKYDIIKI